MSEGSAKSMRKMMDKVGVEGHYSSGTIPE